MMSKTIEYINEEKEWIKHRLDVAKTRLKNAEERKDFVSIETYKKYIDEFKQKLKLFHQIKTELEAWEIVKNKSVDIHDVIHCSSLEVFNCCLYEQYQLTEEEYNKIKKALEKYNEN